MTRRIVVIDDDDDVREVTVLSLSHLGGWQVTAVDGGAAGAKVAGADPPDAILLDVMMPELDGEATARLIRGNAATRRTPIVLLTASAQPPAWPDEQLVTGVIAKPFDPTAQPGEVARLLGW